MKALLICLSPEECVKLLNGDLSVLVRKKFPSDYVGWVYIYCTKKDSLGRIKDLPHGRYFVDCVETPEDFEKMDSGYDGKGKVVARFWCDKVEEMINPCFPEGTFVTRSLTYEMLLKQSCLTEKELDKYISKGNRGIAIHITEVKPFDKPKELSEFWTSNYNKSAMCDNEPQFPCTKCPNTGALYCNCKFLLNGNCSCISLTRAPRNYCYVEA